MRSKSTLISVASSLALVFSLGCGGGGSSSGSSSVKSGGSAKNLGSGSGAQSTLYQNGHPLSVSTSDPAVRSLETDLVTIINAHRVSIGQSVLVESVAYGDLARGHSQHMEVGAFYSSTNDEGDDLTARLGIMGLITLADAENLAQNLGTAAEVMTAWLAVPGEKANLEAANWTHIGAGFHDVGAGTNYWTADFIQE